MCAASHLRGGTGQIIMPFLFSGKYFVNTAIYLTFGHTKPIHFGARSGRQFLSTCPSSRGGSWMRKCHHAPKFLLYHNEYMRRRRVANPNILGSDIHSGNISGTTGTTAASYGQLNMSFNSCSWVGGRDDGLIGGSSGTGCHGVRAGYTFCRMPN